MSIALQYQSAGEGSAVPSLVRYDAACCALAEAKSVDDVKDIRDRSEAKRAYAKQAKNRQLEVDAAEIRIRAERRLGEIIAAQREAGLLSKGAEGTGSNQHEVRVANGPAPITLAEVGVDKALADRARKLAAIPEAEFTGIVSDWRERVERENERVSVNLLKSGERHAARQEETDTRPDAEREFDALMSAWERAGEGARKRFLSVVRPSADTSGAQDVAAPVKTSDAVPNSGLPVQSSSHASANLQERVTSSRPAPAYLLRPHCLNPDLCAGSGSEHCHACNKAMAESDAA